MVLLPQVFAILFLRIMPVTLSLCEMPNDVAWNVFKLGDHLQQRFFTLLSPVSRVMQKLPYKGVLFSRYFFGPRLVY